MQKEVDYIIVGQGIAGTILAYQLHKQAKRCLIIDPGFEQGSSFVAAGLMNPIVLKRLTETWRAKAFLEYNPNFYAALNQFLGQNVYHAQDLFKLIQSDDEAHFWRSKIKEEPIGGYLAKNLVEVDKKEGFSKAYLLGQVEKTAWVQTKKLLKEMRKFFLSNQPFLEEAFKYNEMKHHANGVEYGNYSSKHIVFCEGSKIVNNPLFNELPMGLNKGELLVVKIPGFQSKRWFKKGVFVLPLGKDLYRVGATFEWKWENEEPSKSKKEELLEQLRKLIPHQIEVVAHEAGVRPSVRDRRPLLGRHQNLSNVYLFNGLGSRGCFMAPLLAKELIEFIQSDKKIHPEARLDRFKPN